MWGRLFRKEPEGPRGSQGALTQCLPKPTSPQGLGGEPTVLVEAQGSGASSSAAHSYTTGQAGACGQQTGNGSAVNNRTGGKESAS